MPAYKLGNLVVRFLLELSALVALGYWGFQLTTSILLNILIGIGTSLLAAIAWGSFVAPKAARRTHDPVRLLIEAVVFGSASLALVGANQLVLAFVLATVFAINRAHRGLATGEVLSKGADKPYLRATKRSATAFIHSKVYAPYRELS